MGLLDHQTKTGQGEEASQLPDVDIIGHVVLRAQDLYKQGEYKHARNAVAALLISTMSQVGAEVNMGEYGLVEFSRARVATEGESAVTVISDNSPALEVLHGYYEEPDGKAEQAFVLANSMQIMTYDYLRYKALLKIAQAGPVGQQYHALYQKALLRAQHDYGSTDAKIDMFQNIWKHNSEATGTGLRFPNNLAYLAARMVKEGEPERGASLADKFSEVAMILHHPKTRALATRLGAWHLDPFSEFEPEMYEDYPIIGKRLREELFSLGVDNDSRFYIATTAAYDDTWEQVDSDTDQVESARKGCAAFYARSHNPAHANVFEETYAFAVNNALAHFVPIALRDSELI